MEIWDTLLWDMAGLAEREEETREKLEEQRRRGETENMMSYIIETRWQSQVSLFCHFSDCSLTYCMRLTPLWCAGYFCNTFIANTTTLSDFALNPL